MAFSLSLHGCAKPDAKLIPMLSEGDAAGNARKMGDAVERLCIESSNDPAGFIEEVANIGWRLKQVQEADASTPLAVWSNAEAELIHSQRPKEFSGGQLWTCSLRAASRFSPPIEAIAAEFTRRLGPARPDISDPITWEWRPSPLRKATLVLTSGAEQWGPMVFVELAETRF